MIQAIRDRMEGDEDGFTLIELLVVVIIIGILAAIAVPTFLNQREKAGDSAAQSDIRNAAVAAETVFTETGSYPADLDALKADGPFVNSGNVTVTYAATGSGAGYCMTAVGDPSATVWKKANTDGSPVEAGSCAP